MPSTRKQKCGTIRTTAEIERIMRNGRMIRTPWYRLIYCPAAQKESRFAVIVGKRLGKAVLRNRMKRRFREILKQNAGTSDIGADFLLFPNRTSVDGDFRIIQDAIRKTLMEIVP
jgi:ribonuclease P protein component